jgi:hypothetical protein
VKAAVFAGLEDPLFGIMMSGDRVDKRASLGISRATHTLTCVSEKHEPGVAHTTSRQSKTVPPADRDSDACYEVVMVLTLGREPLEMERVGTGGNPSRGASP